MTRSPQSGSTGPRSAGSSEASRPGPDELARALKEEAKRLGFTLAGITTPEPSAHLALYRRWLDDGMHGEMRYLARSDAIRRRGDLAETLEDVRSVLVVAHEYAQEDPPGVPDDPSRGVIARYARGRDYHKVVKKKLTELGRWLEEAVPRSDAAPRDERPLERRSGGDPARAWRARPRWRAYVDTGPILERDLARRAGLGWHGKNTMLLNPKRGSYFFLGVLLLDIELPADEPFRVDHCGSCTACLDACPTGALLGRDENGAPIMDARRCISYLTIEHRGPIPEELRPLMGNRVFGCDICQEVCPFVQKFSVVVEEPDYAAREAWEAEWDRDPAGGDVSDETSDDGTSRENDNGPTEAVIPTTDGPALVDLMRMSEDEWDAWTRGSAIRRAGYSGLLRNVAVALGNWLAGSDTPDPEAVGELVAALSDEDPGVAEAAAWGLGRARRDL